MARSQAEMQAMREERELLKEFETMPPSEFAKRIVAERPEFDTKTMLRQMAKDMRISVNELAADIIAAKTIGGEVVTTTNPANSLYRTFDIELVDGRETVKENWHYKPIAETIGSRQFEAGHTIVESIQRREETSFFVRAGHSRTDYNFGRELLELVGKEKGFIVSSLPDGKVHVYSTYRAIDPEYAEKAGIAAFREFESGQERVAAAEKAIENAPLKKGTPAMKRELAKALDAMKPIRARMEKATQRIHNANSKSADNIRLEFVAEYDSYENALPGTTAIESLELPNAILRRPFRETMRPRIRRSPVSPVECEVLRNENDAEWELALAQFRIEREKRNAAIAAQKELETENARSITNAEYKERRRIAARIRRAKGK